jgi:hypothetical protein
MERNIANYTGGTRMIIAVDFDGTLAITDYPTILRPNLDVIRFCKRRREAGDTLILWTCRKDNELREAIEWCAEQGLFFNYINENPPDRVAVYGASRKVYADIYLDDHNWLLSEVKG